MKIVSAFAILPFMLLSGFARAEDTPPDDHITRLEITPLYKAHNELETDIGSSKYVFNQQSLDNLPQGEFTPLNEVLLQAPGVAEDAYGQVHIRGDHDGLQYRINGIILPQGISGFGQTLDTHIASKVDLLTGALPAQYGDRTAGIVDITTQTGSFANGGKSSVLVGSNNTLEGNQEFYGSSGNFNYFLSGTYSESDRGLEPPTGSYHTIHDDTTQDKQFGYLSYNFTPEEKLSLIFGNSTNRFEIPNNPNQTPVFALNNVNNVNSSSLNERQFEHNSYAILALNGALNDDTDYQFSYFTRYSEVLFKPDATGDLIYNGIAVREERDNFTNGLQNDFKYSLNNEHMIRTGWEFSYEQANTQTNASVFPCCTASGQQTSTIPFTINDSSSQPAELFSTYLQDEWRLTNKLTLNYGTRFDYYDAYINANQISPRVGLVYEATASTTLHTGYARYFSPPPTELISNTTISQFNNTTAASSGANGAVTPERSNYFDAGINQKVGSNLTLGVDGYYKQARHLLDEGQFGQALILAPFNYAEGWVKGMEFTADYKKGALNGYANLAVSQALGKDVESGQYNFTPEELAYISGNSVHLDHDQLISGSMGADYTFQKVTYGGDVIYGSGLRSGFANTEHLPFYTTFNLSASHTFQFDSGGSVDGKLSIVNLLDKIYEIRDGSGIGVFAPQYAPRRGIFVEISKSF